MAPGGGGHLVRDLLIALRTSVRGLGEVRQANTAISQITGTATQAGQAAGYMGGSFAAASFAMAAGLSASLAITSQFRAQATLAAFAAQGASGSIRDMAASARSLSASVGQSPVAMATLVRQVAQLGGMSATASYGINRVAASLAVLSGKEIGADDAATAIYRLLQATERTPTAFADAISHADRYGSALLRVSNLSAGGLPGTVTLLRNLSSLGTTTNFAAGELIVLAGALTNVSEHNAASFASSLQRLFSKGFDESGEMGRVAAVMNMTTDAAKRMKEEKPFDFYLSFLDALKVKADAGDQSLASLITGLGFTNVRDVSQIAALVNSLGTDKIRDMRNAVMGGGDKKGELFATGRLEIFRQMDRLLVQLPGAWDEFSAAIQRAAIAVGDSLTPALVPLLKLLTGLASVVGENPWLARIIAVGAGGAVLQSGARMFGGGLRGAAMAAANVATFAFGGMGGQLGYGLRSAGYHAPYGMRVVHRGGATIPFGEMQPPRGIKSMSGLIGHKDYADAGFLMAAASGMPMGGRMSSSARDRAMLMASLSATSTDEFDQLRKVNAQLSGHKTGKGKAFLALQAEKAALTSSVQAHFLNVAGGLTMPWGDKMMMGALTASNFLNRPFQRFGKAFGASATGQAMRAGGFLSGLRGGAKGIGMGLMGMPGAAMRGAMGWWGMGGAAQGMLDASMSIEGMGSTKMGATPAMQQAARNLGRYVGPQRASQFVAKAGSESAIVRGLGAGAGMPGAPGLALRSIPVVGQVIIAAQLLTPLFRTIGGFFGQLREGGGLIAGLARPFAILFKALELVGNTVNRLVKVIGDAFDWLWEKISSIPPISWIVDGADWVIDRLDEANAWMRGEAGQSSPLTNVQVYIQGTDNAALKADGNTLATTIVQGGSQYGRPLAAAPTSR